MPRYRFTGFHETVLTGLSHGVNAELHRDDDGEPVDFTGLAESTVVARPRDEVTTAEPYPHAWIVNTDTDAPDLPAAAAAAEQPPATKPRRRRTTTNHRGEE